MSKRRNPCGGIQITASALLVLVAGAASAQTGDGVRSASFYQPLTSPPHAAQAPAGFESPAPQSPPPTAIPLTPRGERPALTAAGTRAPISGQPAVTSVVGALSAVIGIFILVAWGSRKYLPKAAGPLPGEVIESLGWAPLAGKQQVQLLRLGKKLILVSLSPAGAEPLAEVTDEAEVERIATICRKERPGSISATFRNVLSQLEQEPASGFVGDDLAQRLAARRTGGDRA